MRLARYVALRFLRLQKNLKSFINPSTTSIVKSKNISIGGPKSKEPPQAMDISVKESSMACAANHLGKKNYFDKIERRAKICGSIFTRIMTIRKMNIALAIAAASLVALTTVDAEAKSARAKITKGIILTTQGVDAGDCDDVCQRPQPPPSCDQGGE